MSVQIRRPNAPRDPVPPPARIRDMLHAAGLTYADVAAKLDVSRRTIERYLTDSADPPCPYPLFFSIRALCTNGARRGR